jgi:hypothetical protein
MSDGFSFLHFVKPHQHPNQTPRTPNTLIIRLHPTHPPTCVPPHSSPSFPSPPEPTPGPKPETENGSRTWTSTTLPAQTSLVSHVPLILYAERGRKLTYRTEATVEACTYRDTGIRVPIGGYCRFWIDGNGRNHEGGELPCA